MSIQLNDAKFKSAVEPGTERSPRTRVFKGAYAAFNQEHSAIPCIVRDISESGAKIQFDLGWIVPSRFTIFIELDGVKVDCEKVWHRGNLYGVKFISERSVTNFARLQRVGLYDDRHVVAEVEAKPESSQTCLRQPKKPAFGKLK